MRTFKEQKIQTIKNFMSIVENCETLNDLAEACSCAFCPLEKECLCEKSCYALFKEHTIPDSALTGREEVL